MILKSNTVISQEYYVNKKSNLKEILYYERRYKKKYKDNISIQNLNLKKQKN